jgi:cytochrome c-type biogenesis protein CcmH
LFWYFAAALLVLAALFVLLPLWKFHQSGESSRARRERTNLFIFKERIAELEAELAAGTLEQENFDDLKSELERSLLSDVQAVADANSDTGKQASTWRSPSRLIPIALTLIIIPSSIYLYREWGFQDELALAQLYERTQQGVDNPEDARDLIFSLGAIIEEDRENGWAWYFLAQNLVNIGQFPEASMALERAGEYIEEPQDRVVVLSQYAFLEFMLAEQKLTDKVQGIIDQAQRLDPNQLLILQILGMDAEQRADYQSAITYWRRMLQLTPPGEEAQLLEGMIANAQQQLSASNRQDAVAGDGPSIDVELSLAPGLDLDPTTRVFVSALELNGRGQPLAAEVVTVADLPTTITLDNSDAVGPFNISSAEMIYIVATASSSGTANVQSGDYQTKTEGFAHSNQHAIIQLQIADEVP